MKMAIDNIIKELKEFIKRKSIENAKDSLTGFGDHRYITGKAHAYDDVLYRLLELSPEIRDETDPQYAGLPPLSKVRQK